MSSSQASTFRMPTAPSPTSRSPAQFAAGRCTGAMLFCTFGAVWLALGLFAFGLLHWPVVLLLGAVVALTIILARLLRNRLKAAIDREPPHPRQKQDDRTFAWINAAQGLAIFLLFAILPRLGHQEFAVAGAVIVVGLHFLVMPPLYRSRSNLVLGVAMTVWGMLCMIVFHGDRMIAFAALGAGLLLWSIAAWALHTASSIARRLALLV